jgi:hypothetical protein
MANNNESLPDCNDSAREWLGPTLQSLSRLAKLPNNWDGYGSPPLTGDAIQAAHRLLKALEKIPLPTPQVCPVTGGGLFFSWQSENRELDLEVRPDGSTQYLAAEANTQTGQEITKEDSLSLDRPEPAQLLAAWFLGGGVPLMATWPSCATQPPTILLMH